MLDCLRVQVNYVALLSKIPLISVFINIPCLFFETYKPFFRVPVLDTPESMCLQEFQLFFLLFEDVPDMLQRFRPPKIKENDRHLDLETPFACL